MKNFILVLVAVLSFPLAAHACSVFMAEDGAAVWAGNNEDFYGDDPTAIWFVPGQADKYGFVAYGYESNHFSQGGMNDQGLFFDGLATPFLDMEPNPDGKPAHQKILEDILQRSATVEEAVTNLFEYDLENLLEQAQLFFADANGDAVIVEGDTLWEKTENYLIATNFYHSAPELGNHPCWRYDVIEEMMEDGLTLSLPYFTSMADAAHQGESTQSVIYTRYTTVADLAAGVLYLYYALDFENYIEIDIDEALAEGEADYLMADLFAGDDDDDDDDDTGGDDDDDDDTDGDDDDDDNDDDDSGCGCS